MIFYNDNNIYVIVIVIYLYCPVSVSVSVCSSCCWSACCCGFSCCCWCCCYCGSCCCFWPVVETGFETARTLAFYLNFELVSADLCVVPFCVYCPCKCVCACVCTRCIYPLNIHLVSYWISQKYKLSPLSVPTSVCLFLYHTVCMSLCMSLYRLSLCLFHYLSVCRPVSVCSDRYLCLIASVSIETDFIDLPLTLPCPKLWWLDPFAILLCLLLHVEGAQISALISKPFCN